MVREAERPNGDMRDSVMGALEREEGKIKFMQLYISAATKEREEIRYLLVYAFEAKIQDTQ